MPLYLGAGVKIKVYECLSSGIPVVTSKIGAEGIECDKANGLTVVDVHEPESYASEACALLSDLDKLKILSKNSICWGHRYYLLAEGSINMIDLAISIVLYKNNTNDLYNLLEFCKNLKLSYRVYIFDNSLNENIKSYCFENDYDYRSSSTNIGFGKGHNNNLLTNSISAKAYLILNPDITLSSEAVESLYQRLISNEEIFLVSPKLLYPSNHIQYICRLLPTPLSILKRRFFYNYLYNSYIDECKFTNYNKVISPPFIHGACYMIKSDIFKSVNGFDERFFLYMEDIDLYRRINKK